MEHRITLAVNPVSIFLYCVTQHRRTKAIEAAKRILGLKSVDVSDVSGRADYVIMWSAWKSRWEAVGPGGVTLWEGDNDVDNRKVATG